MILLLVGFGLNVCMVYITRLLINSRMPERFRSIMRLLIPAYLLLNLYFTVLMRMPSDDYPIILMPLHSYFAVLGWDVQKLSALRQILQGTWSEPVAFTLEPLVSVAQNLVLFMPFGFLLCGATKRTHTVRILLVGFLLSLLIEICQLLLRFGWFETDDILHNTLGTLLGIRLYRRMSDQEWLSTAVSTKAFRKVMKRVENFEENSYSKSNWR